MSIFDKIEPEEIDMSKVYSEPDVEKQLKLEAKKLLKHKQVDQMHDMRDTNYYCVLVFGNKADKEQFLAQVSDKVTKTETFIDGYEYAKSINVDIQCSAKLPEPHYIQQIKLKNNGNTIRRKK